MNYDCKILNPKNINSYETDFLIKELSELPCVSVVNNQDDLECLKNPRLREWMKFKNFIIFGTGGSALGGECLCRIAPSSGKIKFVSNSDANELGKIFSEIDFENTGILGISKSGETLETICQITLALDIFSKNNADIKKHFVFITENKNSSLKELADKFDILCLDHPKNIGGRYSVFSIVGMLPAALAGLDPKEIREGGKETLRNLRHVIDGTNFVFQNFENHITQHVSFIYSEKLRLLGQWIAQLYAESTGKSKTGITPITAIGAVDQHSQLQLYLDGSNDKCFTFFTEKQNDNIYIDKNAPLPSSFAFLKNKKISKIFEAQSQATISALIDQNRNVRVFEFSQVTPKILGSLFMHFIAEVICVCELMKVNPFDQPAVEKGKILTKEILSHDD